MSTARIPELALSCSAALVVVTGAWLWWFGQNTRNQVIRANDLSDQYALQIWTRRVHAISTWVLIGAVVLLVIQAARRGFGWRVLFLLAFLVFAGVAVWSGYDADWEAARLWSETVGTKLAVGLPIGDAPALPADLDSSRLHLSVIPAVLVATGLLAVLQHRRS